ncbi:diguanylate cyclase domain-containing protein [Stenotrophomonas nitritireducens]|uniref:diguanylate cyclase domain-containing protein n=1 Tax=Stenotrophomonas nitritireducens TaxID=83617 RepID=UPI003D99AA17
MPSTLPPLGEILDLLPDVVCVVDPEGRYLAVNAAFEQVIGYRPDEVLGRRMIELVHPEDHAITAQAVQRVMEGRPLPNFRNRYVRRDGRIVDMQWSAKWLPDYGVRIAVGHPITELRDLERRLEFMAGHDPLTSLPNRYRLREELERSLGGGAQPLAVLYLDLDGFKAINDRHGHAQGDRLLCETADRLRRALRHGDFIARVGGDEFVALLPGCASRADARVVADALQAALDAEQAPPPFSRIGVSIGVACCPADGNDAETLLRCADADMYAVKNRRHQVATT